MSVSQQQVISLLENVLFESAAQATANAATWEANAAATSITSLASAMANSGEEKIAANVVGYYLSSLGRAPTAAEIGFYVSYAEQGLTQSQIAAGQVSDGTWNTIAGYFSHSAEFTARAGLDNSLGVTGGLLEAVPFLYEQVLGRAPSNAEISYYDNQVVSGTDLGVLFREFTSSPEFHTDTDSQIATALAANGTATASGQHTSATIGASVTLGVPPAVVVTPVVVTPVPPTFGTLTTSVYTIDDSAMSGAHTYTAIIGGATTLKSGDQLTGNGLATLSITDYLPGSGASLNGITLHGIQTINFEAGAGNFGTSAGSTLDVSGVTGLASLNLTSGGSNGDYITATSGVFATLNASDSGAVYVNNSGGLLINDDQLTTLTLAGSIGTEGGVDIETTMSSIAIVLNGATVTNAIFSYTNNITALTVSGTGSIDTLGLDGLTTLTVSGAVSFGSSRHPFGLNDNLTTVDLSADPDVGGTNYFGVEITSVAFKVAADTTVIEPGQFTSPHLTIAFGSITSGLFSSGPIASGGHVGAVFVSDLVAAISGSHNVEYGNDGSNTYIVESDDGSAVQGNGFVRVVEVTGVHAVTVHDGNVSIG